ncbi:acylphosphatase [Rubrivirga sp.]|uniref:acylphosphatase n=1 Tax=Rubrivirga sp. TaxID=1885344 RepID=UPI003C74F536
MPSDAGSSSRPGGSLESREAGAANESRDLEVERLTATVRGRVQGVGFRRYVRGWGRKLGLAGWVRNEPDGTVVLEAEGPAPSLDRLTRLLWGGPPTSRVDAVEVERREAVGVPDPFEVRH